MNFFIRPLLLLTSLLFLSACNTTRSPWLDRVYASGNSLRQVESLDHLPIPVLRAPRLEREWGPPHQEASPSGAYRLSYSDLTRPFERLVIYGYPHPITNPDRPPDESVQAMVRGDLGEIMKPQEWRTTAIRASGKFHPLNYYTESSGSGADGTYYGSNVIALTAPDGRTGYYRLVVESVTGAVPRRFSAVGFPEVAAPVGDPEPSPDI